jgi:hypothetical protein
MKTENPYQRAYYTFPLVLIVGMGIDLFYVLYKASSNFSGFEEQLSLSWVLPVSFGTGALCGLVWIFIAGPIAKKRIKASADNSKGDATKASDNALSTVSFKEPGYDLDGAEKGQVQENNKDNEDETSDEEEENAKNTDGEEPERTDWRSALKKFGDSTYNQDLHAQSMHENPKAAKIWEDGEKFDESFSLTSRFSQHASTHFLTAPTTCRTRLLRTALSSTSIRLVLSVRRPRCRNGSLPTEELQSCLIYCCMDTAS